MFQLFIVMLDAVGSLKVFDYSPRIAGYNGVRLNILGYNRTCSDDCSFAYFDAGNDCRTTTNPYIILDRYRLGPLNESPALIGIKRVARGVNAYIRPYQYIIADSYFGFVENGEIEINDDVVANIYITTIIASKRLVNHNILAARPENRAEQCAELFGVVRFGVVVLLDFLYGSL